MRKKIYKNYLILSLTVLSILAVSFYAFFNLGNNTNTDLGFQAVWAQEGEELKFIWIDNIDEDVSSYKLYHGISSGQYGESLETEGSNNFIVLDISSFSKDKHYFAVSALDKAGNESDKSPELVIDLSIDVNDPEVDICGNGIVETDREEICDSNARLCETDSGDLGIEDCNDDCSGYLSCVALEISDEVVDEGTGEVVDEGTGEVVDEDGNIYDTVQIGEQLWLAENLKVGTMLASEAIEPNTGDNVIEKWCYNNDPNNCNEYGGLYSWDEAMKGSEVAGAQGICMDGWHIPTDEEINILENYVIDYINSPSPQYPCSINEVGWGRCADNDGTYSGTYGAGKSLKAVGQGNGTDDVGFDGRFGGYRHPVGTYSSFDSGLFLWSSTFSSSISAFRRLLYLSNSTVYRYSNNRDYGFSIRCLKD